MKKWIAQVGLALMALCFCSAYASPMLTLIPANGMVSGTTGQTVGWGYTINNDTSFYLLVDSSNFCQAGEDPLFTTCTQTQGTYVDYIASNMTVVSPGGMPSQSFNSMTMTGVGAYQISGTAPATDSGSIIVTYQEFNGVPGMMGSMQVSGDIEFPAQSASVTVVPSAAVPEPASFTLAGGVLLMMAARRLRGL